MPAKIQPPAPRWRKQVQGSSREWPLIAGQGDSRKSTGQGDDLSHLSTLIERVRKCERAGCAEQDDCGAGEFLEQTLHEKIINVAEYMTYSHDYTQDEASEAVELLCKYGMGDMVCNPTAISSYIKAFYAQQTTPATMPMVVRPAGLV